MTENNFTAYDLAGDEPREMTIVEVDALKQLCRDLPEQPIIFQIGAGMGCSTLAMVEERPRAFVVSIDTHERGDERKYLQKAGLPWLRVVRVLGKSQDVGIAWPWPCDLLYIDGNHQRPYIDEDILLWTRQVKPGGVIAFHDCILPSERPANVRSEVFEAIEDWLKIEAHQEILWTERVRGFRMTPEQGIK